MMLKINIKTYQKYQIVDITDIVSSSIKTLEKKDGILILYVPHTTAGITINENYDPSVKEDILDFLNKLVPRNGNYKHLEGNADAHIKSSLIGSSIMLILENGEIKLGRWQGILFCEFDGPRQREVWIKVV
ncbi:MAG: secondary thiamine-phosphate synthase enzyme YjbQ [candidate division WOR-3 bacterium]|nr:secondary thiamine-phosphate synthase enzyme YjbQ [candidate division WOR-3 bacterium]MCX7947319.1 secondary thiamine-phosphate synthase enzyme YjbQ [candidate division WOR-3 bacterium]MDW8150125.1 secondary thiamine-phosphate synthase enzyme YjbQ [candidate division WOR-3 bacterium]